MSTVRKVTVNSAAYVVGEIAGRAVNFAVNLLIARYLGPEEFGDWNTALSFVFFFTIFAHQGVDILVTREASVDQSRFPRLLGNGLYLKITTSTIAFFGVWVLMAFWTEYASVRTLIILYSLSLLSTAGSSFNAVFQVRLKLMVQSAITVAGKILHLAIIIALIASQASITTLMLAHSLVLFAPAVAYGIVASRWVKIDWTFDWPICKCILVDSWPISITVLFISIYQRIDQQMLFHMVGSREVGLYSVAVRINEVLVMFPYGYIVTVFPLLAKWHTESQERFREGYVLSFRLMNTLSVPVCLGIAMTSDFCVRAFGANYDSAAPSLAILIWSNVFIFLGLINNRLLVTTNHQALDLIFTGSSAVVNIVLNLMFIPKWGMEGAAIASVIAYAFGPVLGLFIPLTRDYSRQMFLSLVPPGLAAALAGGLFLYLPLDRLPRTGVALIVYVLVFLLAKGLKKREIDLLRQLMGK